MSLLRTHNPIHPLSPEAARELMQRFLDPDTDPLLVGASLALLAQRTPAAEELLAFAETLRAVSNPFPETGIAALDTCGTGGDGASTANLSTLAALLLASLGVPIAKHGNRAATSSCGSADLLESFGYPMGAPPKQLAADLRQRSFAFLFAPAYHPLLGRLKEIRTRLGIPTVFNLLGPLLNPARPAYQVLGVARKELLLPMAGALAGLGVTRAFVIHGEDAAGRGLDEASIEGATLVVEVSGGEVKSPATFHPGPLGIPTPTPDALFAGSREEAVQVGRGIVGGPAHPAHRPAVADAVALQAALGLLLHRGQPLGSLATSFREARAALQVGFELPFEVS